MLVACSGVGGWWLVVVGAAFSVLANRSTTKAAFMLVDHKAVCSCLQTSAFSPAYRPDHCPDMTTLVDWA